MELAVDATRYTLQDLRGTVRNLGLMWDWLPGDGMDSVLSAERAELDAIMGRFPNDHSIGSASRPALERAAADGLAVLHRAGRALVTAGLAPAPATGEVTRLSRGDGGVPKLPADHVTVNHRGVVGDRQAARQHHGRPWQALCLWSQEVIDRFRHDGHPIDPGSAGENVTIGGLDWGSIRSGVQLLIGSVVCEVVAPALPCSKNAQWFLNRDFGLMHHERGAVSRAYAAVLQPGTISVGDEARVLP